jgi:HEAT repeat protein
MSLIQTLSLALSMLLGAEGRMPAQPLAEDSAALREMLYDREHPRKQSQAALLLVQMRGNDAEDFVRQGLRQTDSAEVFIALADAIRLCRDDRFADELLVALVGEREGVREAASHTLAVLADPGILRRLQLVAEDPRAQLVARQAAMAALGRSARKPAAGVLVDLAGSNDESIRKTAIAALTELTGQDYGNDQAMWRTWWQSRKDLPVERWLEERLTYQTSKARRLAGDLDRAKTQLVQLHQQLYARLPTADRLSYVQNLAEHEDPAMRALAVCWSAELWSTADGVGQRALSDLLLRLSYDGSAAVQRPATQALGRVADPRAFERLKRLLRHGPATVRAAAAHALTQQALARPTRLGSDSEAADEPDPERIRQVVPLLQRALDDATLEVVVAAAEDLGSLGVSEAGPVLTALLRHPSEPVRLTAAQALERVADPKVLDGLVAALDDLAVPVRFSLVGALGHVATDGQPLSELQRAQLIARLEELVLRDADAGVRSRAAMMLGQIGPPAELAFLWRRVLSREDSRVHDKAWAAMLDILTHSASIELLRQWDRTLEESNQGARRLQMLTDISERWRKADITKLLLVPATEFLVEAQLDQGKWALALPLIRELLTRPGSDADLDRRLRFLCLAGDRALADGNRGEALRIARDAEPYLGRSGTLAADFETLEKRARQ